jgi:hypothetical protein
MTTEITKLTGDNNNNVILRNYNNIKYIVVYADGEEEFGKFGTAVESNYLCFQC